AVHLAVPWVDVMNDMLDASLPLTTNEYLEWGNPSEKAAYDYMLSYSPYDNIRKTAYQGVSGSWPTRRHPRSGLRFRLLAPWPCRGSSPLALRAKRRDQLVCPLRLLRIQWRAWSHSMTRCGGTRQVPLKCRTTLELPYWVVSRQSAVRHH